MVLTKKKTSKKNLPILPKESAFIKRLREGKEQREKVIQDAKQKIIDDATETKRMEKIIVPYLDKLQDTIVEKDLLYFWVFQDESGFIKHKYRDYNAVQKMVLQNVSKYANRTISSIGIKFYHNDESKLTNKENYYYYLIADVSMFNIDEKGILNGDRVSRGADIGWTAEDFKLSKFSFKLLYVLLNAIISQHHDYTSFSAVPLTYIVNDLQKIGVDFVNTLVPLAGV